MNNEELGNFDFPKWNNKDYFSVGADSFRFKEYYSSDDAIICNPGQENEIRLPIDFKVLENEVKQLRKDLDLIKEMLIDHRHGSLEYLPQIIHRNEYMAKENEFSREINRKYNKKKKEDLVIE